MELPSSTTLTPAVSQIPSIPFFRSRALGPPHALNTPSRVSTTWRTRKSLPSPAPRQGDYLISVRGRHKPPAATTLDGEPSSSPSATELGPSEPGIAPAAAVVRDFYEGINRRELAAVAHLISEACVYEDLIFSRPFVGRQAILDFFKKFTESISSDLQFVIDDISSEDSSAIGVTWHLEWRGKPFPFSKGCSFYRLEVLDGKRQIVYGRDCVEPSAKPGDFALVLIRGVTSILQQFPQLADRF